MSKCKKPRNPHGSEVFRWSWWPGSNRRPADYEKILHHFRFVVFLKQQRAHRTEIPAVATPAVLDILWRKSPSNDADVSHYACSPLFFNNILPQSLTISQTPGVAVSATYRNAGQLTNELSGVPLCRTVPSQAFRCRFDDVNDNILFPRCALCHQHLHSRRTVSLHACQQGLCRSTQRFRDTEQSWQT